MHKLLSLVKPHLTFVLFALCLFTMRSVCADWNLVPSGSMKPTLIEGDYIWVNKMAYDLRVPFTQISVKTLAEPERGDIVIFDSEVTDKRLVKRVIGLPGDRVQMSNNQLYINGERIEQSVIPEAVGLSGSEIEASIHLDGALAYKELLGEESHHILRAPNRSVLANFPLLQVPQDSLLVLGDNRDNSADSRVIGFVPRNEVMGKATHVLVSFNPDNYLLPRFDRFWSRLL